jgi:hypothetical protein
MQTDQFSIGDIHASASIQTVKLAGVVLPFEITNLALAQLGITEISVASVEVS